MSSESSKDQRHGTVAATRAYLVHIVRHELFAILDTAEALDGALRDIRARPLLAGKYAVVLHRDGIKQAASDPILSHEERGTREGLRFGAAAGAIAGASGLALLEAPFEFVGAGPWVAALIGAVVGSALGAFVGAVAGSAYGDTHFQRLASRIQAGQVLISINVAGRARTSEIEAILRHRGAVTTRRIAF